MSSLHTLVYVSAAAGEFTERDIEQILVTARDRNAQDGISGVLLFHDGNFMQCLEGDEAKVRATFARIERDPRHRGVIVLIDAPIDERSFAEWTMGYLHPTQSELLSLSSAEWREFDAAAAGHGRVSRGLVALRSFAKRAR